MRLLLLLLVALVTLIQYPLWVGRGGWLAVWDMQEQVASQRNINEGLRARNQALTAEVEDLRNGTEASEERARAELSMIRQAELFVQILPPDVKAPEPKPSQLKPGAKPVVSVVPAAPAKTTKPAASAPAPKPVVSATGKPVTPSTVKAPAATPATTSSTTPAATSATSPATAPASTTAKVPSRTQ